MPRHTLGDILVSVKEYHYIWLRGGDLNSFRDIKLFMK